MRRLIVLRHAKSSWNTDAPTDHARPLNKRGRRDAPRVAARVSALGWQPQRVISSDSRRTRETWARMAEHLAGAQVSFERDFYRGGLADVRRALCQLRGHDISTVMVIGHNPGWEDMVSELLGHDLRITTCNAALMNSDARSWSGAFSTTPAFHLDTLLRPKELD